MNVLGILLLCRLHKSCGSRDHRSPLQSLPLCWCHDWWHQFRGTPALMHQPHPSMCKMSAGSSSSMGIPSWSCLWHVTWQPGLWRNWREHNKRYLDFRVLPGVIVVPYFPNFFSLSWVLTDRSLFRCPFLHLLGRYDSWPQTLHENDSIQAGISYGFLIFPEATFTYLYNLIYTLYIYIQIYTATQIDKDLYRSSIWPPRNEVKSQDTGQLPWNC